MADTPGSGNDLLAINITESMNLRNQLRTGLLKAQQQDTGKIPVLVSWPPWLEDGIVCMFAGDFMEIIHRAVRETAIDVGGIDPSTLDPALMEPLRRSVMTEARSGPPEAAPAPSTPGEHEETEPEVSPEPLPDVPGEEPAARKRTAQSLADELFSTLKNKRK